MTAPADLRECPFCANDCDFHIDPIELGVPFWIRCNRCNSDGPAADTQELAIEAWNRRAHE